MLVRGLTARGHRVTLFAHPDSSAPCEVVGWRGGRSGAVSDAWKNLRQLQCFATKQDSSEFLIHSFARLMYLLPLLPARIPKIQSYQRAVTPRVVRWGHRLAGRSLRFTACSRSCTRDTAEIVDWRVIPNGVPLDRYLSRLSVEKDAPLVFLGRLEKIKGPHHAVRIAKASGKRLVIAGNVPDLAPAEAEFIRREVLDQCDGDRIRYIGPVDDAGKNALLGSAAAMLFPIEWEEPFGIVMAEALACGTPVLGLARGSVPEVIENGKNGFVRADVDGLISAVKEIGSISREQCRRSVEEKFSDEVVVGQYEALYREAVAAK